MGRMGMLGMIGIGTRSRIRRELLAFLRLRRRHHHIDNSLLPPLLMAHSIIVIKNNNKTIITNSNSSPKIPHSYSLLRHSFNPYLYLQWTGGGIGDVRMGMGCIRIFRYLNRYQCQLGMGGMFMEMHTQHQSRPPHLWIRLRNQRLSLIWIQLAILMPMLRIDSEKREVLQLQLPSHDYPAR